MNGDGGTGEDGRAGGDTGERAGRWGGDPRWAGLDEQVLDDSEYAAGEAGDADEVARDSADRRRDMDGRLQPEDRALFDSAGDTPSDDAEAAAAELAAAAAGPGPASRSDPPYDEFAGVELDTDDDGGLDEGALTDDPADDVADDRDQDTDDERVAASLDGGASVSGGWVSIGGPMPGTGAEASSGVVPEPGPDPVAELARLRRDDPDLAERFTEIGEELVARWPEARIDPTLSRISLLCELLGDPQRAVPAIHLTGTNGKTSTARMTETLLRGLGLRTGTFTSPHLQDVRERIQLDGVPIGIRRFVEVYEEVEPYLALADSRGEHPISFFEAVTALGFAAFADAPVDVSVLEVGLGGRWDATNVADARVAVLTRVAVDHAHLLGNTPVEIAREKVGVVKPGAIVVCARQDDDVLEVVERRVEEVGARLLLAGRDFDVVGRTVAVGGQVLTLRGVAATYDDVFLPLHGVHQADNAACALVAAEAFFGGGARPLRPAAVTEAFAAVTSPGRLELVARAPAVLLDAAHNPGGARAAAAALREAYGFTRVVGVLGVMADKDVDGVLAAFAEVFDEVVLTQNSTARALPAARLDDAAARFWPAARRFVEPELAAALAMGRRLAEPDRVTTNGSSALPGGGAGPAGVVVTGSVVTVGQARTLLRRALPAGV